MQSGEIDVLRKVICVIDSEIEKLEQGDLDLDCLREFAFQSVVNIKISVAEIMLSEVDKICEKIGV